MPRLSNTSEWDCSSSPADQQKGKTVMTEQNPNQDPNVNPQPQPTPPPPGQPVDYAPPQGEQGGLFDKPGPYIGPEPDPDSRTMAMLAHLLAILLGFLGPLIIWLIKKDQSPFVNDQGKEALNFQLTILIALVISGLLACVVIGLFLLPVIAIGNLILCIVAAVAANKGEAYRYPFNIRFIR